MLRILRKSPKFVKYMMYKYRYFMVENPRTHIKEYELRAYLIERSIKRRPNGSPKIFMEPPLSWTKDEMIKNGFHLNLISMDDIIGYRTERFQKRRKDVLKRRLLLKQAALAQNRREYLPRNVGYQRAKLHFESLSDQI
jgi:hypothetical protein